VKLGRYEVVRELGKGAMGIVYLAKDPLIGRLVALKTIRPAAHSDDDETKEFQQRFLREAQAAGILNHPSIVTVHDIGQDDASGTMFIAMEYVEGQNLKEVLAQGRPLTWDQIAEIVAQVADALDFAHAKGIVHRDVKPANIILIDGTRAKITDFGIAKITSGGNLTTTGQFLGTPNYMAPEQIKGAPVDGRTDIFSLGICLYECLTRRKPFGGDSLTSISYKIVHEPFPPLGSVNPQIPDSFEEVVSRCLAKDPARRYQRGRELAAALHAILRGQRPAPPPEPMQAEETLITRDRDKIPTVEVPFPDADFDMTPENIRSTNPNPALSPAMTVPAATAIPAPSPAEAPAAAEPKRAALQIPKLKLPKLAMPKVAMPKMEMPKLPTAEQFRTTLSNVRAYPLWRRPISPAVFIAIIVVLVAGLIGTIGAIRAMQPAPRPVDAKLEKQRALERRLRSEANELWRQGQLNEAYAKFEELNRLAPNSPAVLVAMQKLNAVRQQQQASRQQIAEARRKFDEAMARYNEKKYSDAIPLFEESLRLDPNLADAANYLNLAQQEIRRIEEEKAKARAAKAAAVAGPAVVTKPSGTRQQATTTAAQQPSVSNEPAHVTTSFANSTFNDGYILVKLGSQLVAHEYLFQETGRSIFRRKSPRSVNVTKDLTASSADLEIWVVVPGKIQEHKVMPARLQPGSQHHLTITYDPQSKTFGYQLD
jgi:serine/threonine protein kinase/tetratricopeptide (TPR) repeat protein